MLYCHNTTIQIYRSREIRNTGDSPLFRYETFINFLTLVFPREERETHNSYNADCTIWPNKRTAHHVAPPAGLARPRVGSQLKSFSKSPTSSVHRFHAWRHSHRSHISYLGFLLWHLWLSYPLRTSVNCTQCVCTCTKRRIFLSPSKPNDKI